MIRTKTITKLIFAMAFSYSSVYGQQVNPNKLPPCPKPDYSKSIDLGVGGRTEKWTNCWGRYVIEIDNNEKGIVYDGEWQNGLPHGQATMTSPKGSKHVGEMRNGKRHGQITSIMFNGDMFLGEYRNGVRHGQGTYNFASGDKYVGEWKDSKKHGQGTYTYANGDMYVGEFKDDKSNGQGIRTTNDGKRFEGIWENDNFIREAKVNIPLLNNSVASSSDQADIDRERQKLAEERKRLEEDKRQQEQQAAIERQRQQLAEERKRLEEEKRQREQAKASSQINLQISVTKPTADGAYTISIQTNADTASLKINGEEIGGRADGRYTINRIARAGQDTKLDFIATDI